MWSPTTTGSKPSPNSFWKQSDQKAPLSLANSQSRSPKQITASRCPQQGPGTWSPCVLVLNTCRKVTLGRCGQGYRQESCCVGGMGNGPRAGAAEMCQLKLQMVIGCATYLDTFAWRENYISQENQWFCSLAGCSTLHWQVFPRAFFVSSVQMNSAMPGAACRLLNRFLPEKHKAVSGWQ